MLIKKRDGRLEEFDPDKILESIKKAAMAVEYKDDELQDRARQVQKLRISLLESGFDADDVDDMTEQMFDGYISDGEYTEYDNTEAEEVLEIVAESLDELGQAIVEADLVQDFVEKALMDTGHAKTAKEYIIHSSNRGKVREMNTSLMASYRALTFGASKDVETKRENANIDGDSAMGTMLKYGSEGAKKFNLLYLVPPEQSEAHSNGDIHIHDLDFLALTETCISGDTMVTIKRGDDIAVVRAHEFDAYLEGYEDDTVVNLDGIQILSKGKFVDIKNCVRHSSNGKRVLKISTGCTDITVTSEHKIPVIRDGKTIEIKAEDIKLGDNLVYDHKEFNGSLQYINLVDYFKDKCNIVIYNSDYVLECIKSAGHWKKFCSRVGYSGRGNQIRYGKNKINLEEYILYIRDLKCVDERELKLSYRRTRGTQTIDAVLKLTKELGKFMGYIFSEGSIGIYECLNQESPEKRACFVNYDIRMIEDFNNCINSVFNNAVIKDRYTYGVHSGTHLSGYMAYELFHGPLGVKDSLSKMSLPEWIYSANKDFLNGFYSALIDGDGTVQKDGYRIAYSSVCRPFIDQLQRLLLLNGIRSSVSTAEVAGTQTEFSDVESTRNFDVYKLNITTDNYKLNWVDSIKIREVDIVKRSIDRKDSYFTVTKIEDVDYSEYVYDFETENHYFSANGITVHNCCQIDLDKLFTGGFNTGHGFLREPGEIRSYAALACIAIQSNQNDMHKIA